MALAVRQQMVVDQNHAIHLQNPELKPGNRVEVIVLVAPPDFSVALEKNLYVHGH